MIDTKELKKIIRKNGLSQRKIAKIIGITEKTFYTKMKKGVFDSDEMQIMVDVLNIKNPCDIFFTKVGT